MTSLGGESTYLCMKIATVRNGENGFTGTKLHSIDYDCKINAIGVETGKTGGRFFGLKRAINFAIGVRELIWIAIIATHGAIYNEAATSPTFEVINEFRNNPSDLEEKVAGFVPESMGRIVYSQREGRFPTYAGC